jgi:hypothetical protein
MIKAKPEDVNMYLVGFRITLTDYAQELHGHWSWVSHVQVKSGSGLIGNQSLYFLSYKVPILSYL